MRVLLGFPFRGTGARATIFELVKPIVQGLYPFDECIVRDSTHDEFNRAASRNLIAQYAMDGQYNVCVICDADSIPDQDILREAIEECDKEGEVRIPFDIVKVLPMGRFVKNPTKYASLRQSRQYGPSCGGIYIFRPTIWRTLGGMDERIEGWGYEDRIFLSVLRTFNEGPIYHVGNLYNIDHQRDMSSLEYGPNRDLMERYLAAEGNQDAFKLISAGSNHFRPHARAS
jgi:predicted glycosyltransferase involved in capsule biosynthesis